MPVSDDAIERLRASDPVDQASLPSAESATARELFERITMTETKLAAPHRKYALVAAAAGILVAGAAIVFATRGDGGTKQASGATPTSVSPGGAISPAGGVSGSCVENYDLTTLPHREVAFDGVVQNVDGDTITFTVNHWFRGGTAATATRQGAAVLGGTTSAGRGTSLAPGSRLLVAGDGEFAWACGFTQVWSAEAAAQWNSAFPDS